MSVSNTNSPGRVQVSRAIKEWRDGEPVFGPTKSSKPRAVRVPRFLADMLEQQLRSLPGGIDPNALVFTTIRDTNVNGLRAIRREPFVTNHFRPAVKAVVPDKAKLRLHDLRHT
jgi:integrase